MYNSIFGTSYECYLYQNFTPSIDFIIQKLINRQINENFKFHISNRIYNKRFPNFSETIMNMKIDYFNNQKIIDFVIWLLREKNISVSENELISHLLQVKNEY